jgi:glyceraldehyde 3-phosphate dehydrogenase
MALRVGINGLGRIGRCVARAIYETQHHHHGADIELVACNGTAAAETHAHLLQYDSVHGRFPFEVRAEGEHLNIAGKTVKLTKQRDPKLIPWAEMGVDVVLECTGKFNKKSDAIGHLAGGAKKVLISAPAEEVDATIVFGVNNAMLHKDHQVVSVGSCTTNGLAPLAMVLHESFGIESGFMTTVHAYTGDQNIVDNNHKDLRRARAAGLSIIHTSTGAAKTIGLILPELQGKLDGVALRVPTPNVSLIDLTFVAMKDVTKDEINAALETAANGKLKGVLATTKLPLVSIDFTHSTASSTADLTGTKVTGKRLARVASWYDNEWAFSCRMLDVAKLWTAL